MGDHSHHHTRSLSTDLYGILGISSKGSSIKDMCKAYKSLVHKWYPDHRSPSSKSEEEGNFKDIDEAYKVSACMHVFHANSMAKAYRQAFALSFY